MAETMLSVCSHVLQTMSNIEALKAERSDIKNNKLK